MLKKLGSLAQSQIALLDKVYQEFQNSKNLEFPSLNSRIPYENTARNSRIPKENSLRILAQFFIGWLSFFALFTLKALRSPAPYAKAFARFPALRLKSCRKTFANATATALLGQRSDSKSKNRYPTGAQQKNLGAQFYSATASFRIPKREFFKENSLNQNSLR